MAVINVSLSIREMISGRTWLDGRLPSDGPRACAPPTMCTFWDWVIEMEKRHFPIGVILWANFDATSLQLYVVTIQSSPV